MFTEIYKIVHHWQKIDRSCKLKAFLVGHNAWEKKISAYDLLG
jgi:hypothetical protein